MNKLFPPAATEDGKMAHQKTLLQVVTVFLSLVMVGGAFLGMVPEGWAQVPGDVGSTECREAQLAAQAAVTNGGPYQNHGRLVSTAAHVVSPAAAAGTITTECASCIMHQFAQSIPVEEQTPCGTEACGEFPPNTLPSGNYLRSCAECSVSGCALSCFCADAQTDPNACYDNPYGVPEGCRFTSLDLTGCDSSQDILNENGVLTCTPR